MNLQNLKVQSKQLLLKKYRDKITLLALSTLTVLTYYQSFWYVFIFDDLPNITNNFAIKNPDLPCFFLRVRWLSTLFNKYTYKYWKLSASAYRLGAFAIHLLCGITIFYIVKILLAHSNSKFLSTKNFIIATLTSGLFLLHPVSTQTATYITQARMEGLAALFIFLTILSFICAAFTNSQIKKFILYLCSFTIAVFGTGAKEITFLIPPLLLLVDWFFISNGKFKKMRPRAFIHASFWITVFLIFAHFGQKPVLINAVTLNTVIDNNRGNILTATASEKIKPLVYMMSQFKVILHYIKIFFFPHNLSFDYSFKLAKSFWSLEVILPLLLLLTILGIVMLLLSKNKTDIISFCILWFFGAILPRASIIPSTEFACDYKTYIASFGLLLLIAIMLTKLFYTLIAKQKVQIRYLPHTYMFILFTSMSVLSYNRNLAWSSKLAFWEDVIKHCPNKPRVLNNYAAGLLEVGKVQEAIKTYKKAIRLDPTYAEPVINLALQYQGLGKNDEAMELYKQAINMKEVHPEMYLNIGSLHMQAKRYWQAEQSVKVALKINPHYDKAYFNLGLAYQRQNKFKEACETYEKAFFYGEESLQLNYVHGEVCYNLGMFDKAINSLIKVKAQNPAFIDTQFLLGSCYYAKYNYEKAFENFRGAYNKDPNSVIYTYNLAQTLLNLKRYKEAQPLFEKCKSSANQLPYAVLHNAKCLVKLDNRNEALVKLENFIKTTTSKKVKQEAIEFLRTV